MNWNRCLRYIAGSLLSIGAGAASAQEYPAKTVTLVIPYAAGGPTDLAARVVATALETKWKQSVIVENRPGAGSMVGTGSVANAEPDGYTLLANSNAYYTATLFNKSVPYDPNDLVPVVQLSESFNILSANPSVEARNLNEMLALVKANPGKYNYGTLAFTTLDLDLNAFLGATGLEMQGIPYNSQADIQLALLKNEVQFIFGIQISVTPAIKEGKVVPIATLAPERIGALPDVPTAKEQGLDFVSGNTFGILAPAAAPQNVRDTLQKDVVEVLRDPAVQEKLAKLNVTVPKDPAGWPAKVKAELERNISVAAKLNIVPQ